MSSLEQDPVVLPNLKDLPREASLWARFRVFVPYLGPAFLVSVGYMDPGNWATNIAGGASFGYALLWVLLLSNLMALLLQTLAAKLGIVTGRTLAENCRDQFSKPVTLGLWLVIEAAMLATDLAELLGAAIGFQILFGIPLFPATLLAGFLVFVILSLYRFGFRRFEGAVIALIATIGICYVCEIITAHNLIQWPAVLRGIVIPTLPPRPAFAPHSQSSLLMAIGMIGATVMPHNLFLHSGVIHTRVGQEDNVDKPGERDVHTKKVVHFAVLDSILALNIAWLVNSAMIIVAAATFFSHHLAIDSIETAYQTLRPLLGGAAPLLFGIALLAAGVSSSVTGTLAGQMVMEGFLHREIPLWLRRTVTMVPALIIIYLMPRFGWGDATILVISQVFLSLALPFAVIPLLLFTRRKDLMREHTNRPLTNVFAVGVASLILVLNALLLWQTFGGPLPF